jgi:hypothetical protein
MVIQHELDKASVLLQDDDDTCSEMVYAGESRMANV